MARVEADTGNDCGWWAPGDGEPGTDWVFTRAPMVLTWDGPGESIDVGVMTPDGRRMLAAVPVEAVAQVLALGLAQLAKEAGTERGLVDELTGEVDELHRALGLEPDAAGAHEVALERIALLRSIARAAQDG